MFLASFSAHELLGAFDRKKGDPTAVYAAMLSGLEEMGIDACAVPGPAPGQWVVTAPGP